MPRVIPVPPQIAGRLVTQHHYLHRRPPISDAYGIDDAGDIVGVVTFGTPASRHLQKSACPSDPSKVTELNRLWVHDDMPRNTEVTQRRGQGVRNVGLWCAHLMLDDLASWRGGGETHRDVVTFRLGGLLRLLQESA